MKGNAPSFQFYPDSWLSSTDIMLMTPSEEGAFIRLLAYAWLSPDCGLPDDDRSLSVLSRLGDEWFKGTSSTLRKKFISDGSRLFNLRLLEERKKQEIRRVKSSQGGKKSAKLREEQRKELRKCTSTVLASRLVPKSNLSSPSPSPSPVKKENTKETFELFWKAYPRKVSKPAALRAWKSLSPGNGLVEKIIADVTERAGSDDWTKEARKFCPHPSSYLNQRRWEDETQGTKPPKPKMTTRIPGEDDGPENTTAQ